MDDTKCTPTSASVDKINIITNKNNMFIMYIYVPSGAIFESQRVSGISHLLEHMMFKNKGAYSQNISKSLTHIGGRYNAATYRDVTYYYIQTHMSNYKHVIDILYQITQKLNFTNKDLVTEKEVVLQEMGQSSDNFDSTFTFMTNSTLLDKDNVYMNSVIGTRKTISNITIDDLKAYAKKHYKNFMVYINCDESIEKSVHRHVHSLFGKPAKLHLYDESYVKLSQKFAPKIMFVQRSYKQYSTTLVFKTFPGHEYRKNVILEFLQYCLTASGLYSILNHAVRVKRGLVYTMQSYVDVFRYIGMYYIAFSSNSSKTDYIVNLILNALYNLKTTGMTDTMLQYYKKSYLNTLKFRFTNEPYKTEYMGLNAFYGVRTDYNYIVRTIEKLDSKEIADVAHQAFNFTEMGVLSVGDYTSVNNMSRKVEEVLETYAIKSKNI